MTAVDTGLTITTPGIYEIPEDLYHADPVPASSLSVSGAKKLLPPSCPAKFQHDREHPHAPSKAMNLGTAAHKMVLGVGAPIHVVDAKDWRTKKAQDEKEEHEALGDTVLLPHEDATVKAMAAAIREHPMASVLLGERDGNAEQSIFWQDAEFGVWRRSRLDFLPAPSAGRIILVDYKSAVAADLKSIEKAVLNFGYHMQDAWYTDAVAEFHPGADVAFTFVFQETTAPYLVQVVQLDVVAAEAGRERNRVALEKFRDCTASGVWPAYSGEVELVSLPFWAINRREDLYR